MKHECKIPYTGHCCDGEKFECLDCGIVWEHVCGEAEGCYWENVGEVETLSSLLDVMRPEKVGDNEA